VPKTSKEIRNAFLDFFAERGHERMASGPLVPANDPTLMFANAGMVPFKDVFTGKDIRPYKRATSSQKCIRISGKHNDLENVGVTARHHTFFEMLGNFSFGDYFKRDAIQYAWTFFTEVLKLDPNRIVVTVFGGEEGLAPADDEAAAIWKDVTGFPDERIIRCGAADNFWQMGDTGPCGPCSELHYCLGVDEVDPRKFGEEPTPDGRGWFELWNLVFMQFDRQSDGRLVPLPAPSIDTGAGLERVCVVAQDVLSNYDTDLLRPVVDLASVISGKRYGASQADDDVSMRVIADHARTTAFLISEGIFPDRVGRPYVLRRVMRRAIRHGHRLGIGEPFLHECALRVVDDMGDIYPQLRERRDLIADITRQEEERFRATLKRGLDLLDTNTEWATPGGHKTLPGATVFKLYDTFGFPVDLQEVIGREHGFAIDQAGFDAAMAAAKDRSKGSKLNESEAVGKVYHDVANQHGQSEFVGYASEQTQARVLALVNVGEAANVLGTVDPAVIDALEENDAPPQAVILDKTPFYAEKGGQVGDQGELRVGDAVFVVTDTRAPVDGLHVHVGYLKSGALKAGRHARCRGGPRAAQRHAPQPQRHAPPALGAARGGGTHGHAEGLARGPVASALRLQRHAAAQARGAHAHRRPGERRHPGQRGHHHRRAGHGRGQGGGRHRHLRREVRRRGAHAAHRALARALRWHARAAHGRHWALQDPERERPRSRRAAHRGHHGHERARAPA
jgi:alanyl-tRNA synthetase